MDSAGRRVFLFLFLSLFLFLPFSLTHTHTYTRSISKLVLFFALSSTIIDNRPRKRRNFFPLCFRKCFRFEGISRLFKESSIINHLSIIVEIILPPGIFEELLFFAWVFRAKGIKLDQVILKPTVGKNYYAPSLRRKTFYLFLSLVKFIYLSDDHLLFFSFFFIYMYNFFYLTFDQTS